MCFLFGRTDLIFPIRCAELTFLSRKITVKDVTWLNVNASFVFHLLSCVLWVHSPLKTLEVIEYLVSVVGDLKLNFLLQMQFMLLFSRQGKLRLQKWYVPLSDKERKKISRDLVQTILARKPKMCSFLEWRDLKIVYKRWEKFKIQRVASTGWFIIQDACEVNTWTKREVSTHQTFLLPCVTSTDRPGCFHCCYFPYLSNPVMKLASKQQLASQRSYKSFNQPTQSKSADHLLHVELEFIH